MEKETENDDNTEEGRLRRLRTILSSGIAHQSIIFSAVLLFGGTMGASLGYSAILLPQLQSDNSSIPIDEDTGSWIASLQSGVSPVGTIVGGISMDKWGRRFTMRIGVLPLFLGYVVLFFAHTHVWVLIGRFITGIAAGFSAAASQIIICEIATPRLRGLIASSLYTAYSGGILLVYLLGSYLSWNIVAAVVSLLPLICFLEFLVVPETPIWLVKNEHIEEAEMALRWLRGNEREAKQELKELLSTLRTQQETESESSDDEESAGRTKQKIINQVRTLLVPSILKPFFIGHIICLFQILSGTVLVIFYAVDLISETNQNDDHNYTIAQLTALVRLVFVVVTNSLFYFVQRRTHTIVSSFVCATSALILGIFLYFQSRESYSVSPTVNMWITATLILIFIAANTCSFLPLPPTIMSEILPIKIRGAASGYIFAVNDITQFLISKSYPWLKDNLGAHGIFIVFGINSLLFLIFCFLFMPETQGKSLSQIEEYFRGRNLIWKKRDRRLGRDYTRKKYFEMKKVNIKETVTTYSEPVTTYSDPDATYSDPVVTYSDPVTTFVEPIECPESIDVDERPKRNKRKLSVTFS
ncbi:hypothetical protein C0J52_23355 [Blattella germanica]|nr:hypothetical protein C0J52_23355 [Blattella germanica]